MAGLLELFFKLAPDEVRGHAIEFVGQTFSKAQEQVPPEPIEALTTLWESRLSVIRASSGRDFFELINFGWWFASGKFEKKWAITKLVEVLKTTGKVEPAHLVLKELALLSKAFPLESVRSLGMMVAGDREGWRVHSWREDARTILTSALVSKDVAAQGAAEELINRLCAQGFLDYRDLLR
jgi:hypothetical protein